MPPPRPSPAPASGSRRFVVIAAVVAAVAGLVYALFFWPSDEEAIRAVVLRLADAVEVQADAQNPALRALRLRGELAEVLSEDVRADIPELSAPLQGRREITALAAGAGTSWASARVSLESMRIQIEKKRKRASVRATATLTATDHGGRLRRDTRSTSLSLDKVERRWWITSIEVSASARNEELPQ